LSQKREEKIKQRKKHDEKLMALLKTNEKLEATYNGVTLECSGGILKVDSLADTMIS
jgi:hypothetical protein